MSTDGGIPEGEVPANVKVVSLNVHSDGASLAPPTATTGAPSAAGTH